MRLIVTTHELHYAGKTRRSGEIFDASENDAKVLKLVKRAADAPPEPLEPRGQVASTQPVAAEPLRIPVELDEPMVEAPTTEPAPEADEPAADPATPRPRYRTRRLTAED